MTRHEWISIGALVCLSLVVQSVILARGSVPGLDAVGFVRYAQTIDRQGLPVAVHAHWGQPLFPLWLWAVHAGFRAAGVDGAGHWALAAQVAAAVPLVLSVVPVFLLSRRLVGPRGAVAGTALVCVLPEVAQLGGEGISDSLHLLLAAVAIWLVVEAFSRAERESGRQTNALWLLAGLTAGVAALVRAEVLVLPVAAAVSLLLQRQRDKRRTAAASCVHGNGVQELCPRQAWTWHPAWAWHPENGGRRVFVPGVCLFIGLGLVLGPYVLATGATTPREAVARVLGRAEPAEPAARPLPVALATLADEPGAFAVKEPGTSIRRRGLGAALLRYGEELADVFGYGAGLVALAGWWFRRRSRQPAEQFARVFFVVFSLVVIAFVATEGYLAARHLVLLVAVGTGALGAGAWELGRRVARWPGRAEPRAGWSWSVVVPVGVVLAVLACWPIHEPRTAHREAGCWLAEPSQPAGAVLDTRGWTALYSARPTYQYDRAQDALADPRLAYIVVREEELVRASPRSTTLRRLLALGAERVARFAGPSSGGPVVLVFQWHPERLASIPRGDVRASSHSWHDASGRKRSG